MTGTVLFLLFLSPTSGFLGGTTHTTVFPSSPTRFYQSSQDSDESEQQQQQPEKELQRSTVRMDDGGSDLTDRFKYKVNALMGAFDPADSEKDTEHEDGNILNAMLKFPVTYTFHVVGKTNDDPTLRRQFVQNVQTTVQSQTTAVDEMACQVTPRGKKFTKVSIEAEMDSAESIAAVYNQLGKLELSVMRF